MSWLQCKFYLFPKDIRITYFVGSLFGVSGLAAFSCFMWHLSGLPENDQNACVLLACLFTLLTGWCIYSGFCNLKIILMRYEISNNVAINYYGNSSIRINLDSEIMKYELVLPLKIAKSNYYIDYYLVTNTANKKITTNTGCGIKVLRNLWESGVVVLPKSILLSSNE